MNEKLKQARKLRGWSQGDVAQKIDSDTRNVGRWERGEVTPSPYYQQKLCELFGMNAEELGFIEIRQQGSLENGKTSYPAETQSEPSLSPDTRVRYLPSAHQNGQTGQPPETQSELSLSANTRAHYLLSDRRNKRLLVGGLLLLLPVTIAAARLVSLYPYKKAFFALLYTYESSQRILVGGTEAPQQFNDVKWSPDGKYIACAGGLGVVEVFSARDGRLKFSYNGHVTATPQQREVPGGDFAIDSVTWSPDGKYLASAGADKTVQVWDTTYGTLLALYRGHAAQLTSVTWSPEGRRIASCDRHGIVQVWDAASRRTLLTYKGHQGAVFWIAWSPDGKYLASGGIDRTVQVWDGETGHLIFMYLGHVSYIYDLMWSPDGKRIVSASADTTVQVWEPVAGKLLVGYNGHTQPVRAAGWSPDGKYIASAGDDGTVQIWDATNGNRIFIYDQVPTIWAVAWSPNGRFLASSNVGTVQIWQFNT
jgi:WD40 repeat protein